MRRILWIVLLFGLSWLDIRPQDSQPAPTPTPIAAIFEPTDGQAIQGKITITGRTPLSDVVSYSLEFAYTQDSTQTWFLIFEGTAAVFDGPLADWDTTTITDGDYHLRLTIHLGDGSTQSAQVDNLRVRNYSPIETPTPGPTPTPQPPSPGDLPTATPVPTLAPTPPPPSLTPLPTNPASITLQDVTSGVVNWLLGTLGVFVVIGVYLFIRKPPRRW